VLRQRSKEFFEDAYVIACAVVGLLLLISIIQLSGSL